MIHRLQAKFGSAITVMYLHKTATHYKRLGPLSFDEEAAQLRTYFLDSLKVNDPVLLEETPVSRRPSPDDRLVFGQTHNEVILSLGGFQFGAMIVDGHGIVRSLYSLTNAYDEIRMEEGIERVLRGHARGGEDLN
jgi:hypothetical protein